MNIGGWIRGIGGMVGCLLLFGHGFGQSPRQLKVGDAVPDLHFSEVAGSVVQPFKLSEVKRRLLILDFWSKTCSVCISGFPELNHLQDQFKEDVGVLLVTGDKMSDYLHLKKRSDILNSISLPIVVNEKTALSYFPSPTFPYQVWLNDKLEVVAITDGRNTNAETVHGYLTTGRVPASIQKHYYLDFKRFESLLTEGNGRHTSSITSYSVFFDKLPNVDSAERGFLYAPNSRSIAGVKILNGTLQSLCWVIFSDFIGRIAYQSKFDSLPNPVADSLLKKVKFCYEMRVAQRNWGDKKYIEHVAYEDMKRNFGLDTFHEFRKVTVYKLQRISSRQPDPVSNTSREKAISEYNNGTLILKNAQLELLLTRIEQILLPEFVRQGVYVDFINETGLRGKYDLSLKILEDTPIAAINDQLRAMGLTLLEDEESRKFLVLKEQ